MIYIGTQDNAKAGILTHRDLETTVEKANAAVEALQALRQSINGLTLCCDPADLEACRDLIDGSIDEINAMADATSATLAAAVTAESPHRQGLAELLTERLGGLMTMLGSGGGATTGRSMSMSELFGPGTVLDAPAAQDGSSQLSPTMSSETSEDGMTSDTGDQAVDPNPVDPVSSS